MTFATLQYHADIQKIGKSFWVNYRGQKYPFKKALYFALLQEEPFEQIRKWCEWVATNITWRKSAYNNDTIQKRNKDFPLSAQEYFFLQKARIIFEFATTKIMANGLKISDKLNVKDLSEIDKIERKKKFGRQVNIAVTNKGGEMYLRALGFQLIYKSELFRELRRLIDAIAEKLVAEKRGWYISLQDSSFLHTQIFRSAVTVSKKIHAMEKYTSHFFNPEKSLISGAIIVPDTPFYKNENSLADALKKTA